MTEYDEEIEQGRAPALDVVRQAMIAEILDAPPAERTIPMRRAALSTALRMTGNVELLGGRPDAITVAVDDEQVAAWSLYGLRSLFDHRWRPVVEHHRPGVVTLRVTRGAARLTVRAGLLDGGGHLLTGLPTDLATTTNRAVLVGVWQGALLTSGRFTNGGRREVLHLQCPTQETALDLAGVALRLGIGATITRSDTHEVVVRTVQDVAALLTVVGAPQTAGRTRRIRPSDAGCSAGRVGA